MNSEPSETNQQPKLSAEHCALNSSHVDGEAISLVPHVPDVLEPE